MRKKKKVKQYRKKWDCDLEKEHSGKPELVGESATGDTEVYESVIGVIKGDESKNSDNDEKVKFNDTLQSILAAQKRLWICNVCGKEMKTKQRLGLHVEVHIDGTSHSCNLCGNT